MIISKTLDIRTPLGNRQAINFIFAAVSVSMNVNVWAMCFTLAVVTVSVDVQAVSCVHTYNCDYVVEY